MKTVQYIATLFYYDGPQVFEAQDDIGGCYVGASITQPDGSDGYLIKGVNPNSLNLFRAGEMDLRTLLLEVNKDEWYLTYSDFDFSAPIKLEKQSSALAKSKYLPDEGFMLHEHPADDFAVREARTRSNTVVVVTANPPSHGGQHRISADVYKQLLGFTINLAKYAYKAVLKDMDTENAVPYKKGPHMMDVVAPALPGSFRFVLEAAQQPDLVGDDGLSRAWQRVDELFESVANISEDHSPLQRHRGHLAGTYLNLLNLLAKHNIGIEYAWATQNSVRSNICAVSADQAKPFVNALSKIDKLGAEEITLVGEFEKFILSSGDWGLFTEEGKVSGKIKKDGPTLNGLEVGGRYQFHCIEEITQSPAGDEKHILYLQGHEPAT